MLKVKSLTGNLMIVKKIKEAPKQIKGIIAPNTKGKHILAKVIKLGPDVKHPDLKEGSIVAIKHDQEVHSILDMDRYDFQKDDSPSDSYHLINEYCFDMIVEFVEEELPQETTN